MRMKMKSRIFALAAAIAAITTTGVASAQDYSFSWNPRSGDVWVDTQLDDVNRYGTRYREPFVNEMVRYYGAPRDLVSELLGTRNWAPGDVYYACSIAQVIGRPCRYVVEEWDRDHGQGWGNVAQRLGIKPGSPEFHRLKRGFVPTYDRWARPISIDDQLRREFPNRAHGKSADLVRGDHGKGKADRGNSGKGSKADGPDRHPAKAGKHQGAGSAKGSGNGNDSGKGAKGDGNAKGGKGDKGNGKGNGKG